MAVRFADACAMAECRSLLPRASDSLLAGLAGQDASDGDVVIQAGSSPGAIVLRGSGPCRCQFGIGPEGVLLGHFDADRIFQAWQRHLLAARLLGLYWLVGVIPARLGLLGFDGVISESLQKRLGCPGEIRQLRHLALNAPEKLAGSEEPVAAALPYAESVVPEAVKDLVDDMGLEEELIRRWQEVRDTQPINMPADIAQKIRDVQPSLPGSRKDLAETLARPVVAAGDVVAAASFFDQAPVRIRHAGQSEVLMADFLARGGLMGGVFFSGAAARLRRLLRSRDRRRSFRLRQGNLSRVGDLYHALGSLGKWRDKMPQIPAEGMDEFLNFVRSEGVQVTADLQIPAALIMPVQKDLDADKVDEFRDKGNGADRPILVSEDNRVLDGHHRWAYYLSIGSPVAAIKIHADTLRCLDLMDRFLSGQRAAEGTLDASAGFNRSARSYVSSPASTAFRPVLAERQIADDWGAACFALETPNLASMRPWSDYPAGDYPETDMMPWSDPVPMPDRVARLLARRFRRPFGDTERESARDALSSMSDSDALDAYRKLVKRGRTPHNARDAGRLLYRILGRAEHYQAPDEPEHLKKLLRDWDDGKKHLHGLRIDGRNSILMRRNFLTAWKGVRRGLRQVLGFPGRREGGPDAGGPLSVAGTDDRSSLADCEEALRQSRLAARTIRADLDREASQARETLARMLQTDRLCHWTVSHQGGAQAHPEWIKAFTWVQRLVSFREGESGKINVVADLRAGCLRGGFVPPATIYFGSHDTALGLCHLLGHVLESQLPGAGGLCRSFLRHRCRGEWPTDMALVPGGQGLRGELGRLDTFDAAFAICDAHYVGKANHGGATEVLAMGLQSLWEDSYWLATADAELATLVMGILKGDLRDFATVAAVPIASAKVES